MTNLENEQINDICIYDRKRAELTGISEVIGFTDSVVVAACKSGNLSIDGEDLKIESFDSESGKLAVSGKVNGVFYYGGNNSKSKKRKLFG